MENGSYTPKYYVPSDKVRSELQKYMLVDGFDIVLDYDKSNGSTLYDGRNNRKFLDFFTFFASAPVGMNHPKMMTQEFIDYLGRMAVNNPSNSDIYTDGMATFVKTFFKVAVPDYFKYSFFVSGGALAVENALKAAFDWKVKKNFKKGYNREVGQQILHFRQAFHGRTGYTMSLTNTDENKIAYFPKFSWPRVLNPKMTFPQNTENIEQVVKLEQESIREIKQAFIDNKDDIAAIILEPIQGEGGDNHFRPEFMKALRTLCDENDALLIFDEVQTGGGLTGTFWCHEQLGVEPDIMSFGKKMQVCGILAGKRIDEIENNVFHKSGRINSTWGGNLTDMVRSTKYLEIVEEENLLDNVRKMSTVFATEIAKLAGKFPQAVSNLRGRGLFCAFDISTPELRDEFRDKCWNKGLMVLTCGIKSIRFRPALNITENEIKTGFAIMDDALKEMCK